MIHISEVIHIKMMNEKKLSFTASNALLREPKKIDIVQKKLCSGPVKHQGIKRHIQIPSKDFAVKSKLKL